MSLTAPPTTTKTQPLPLAARALAERRRVLGLSQTAVANATTTVANSAHHLSQRAISHLETGATPLSGVDLGRAMALAGALQWSLFELLSATGLETRPMATTPPPDLEQSLAVAIARYGERFPELRSPQFQRNLLSLAWNIIPTPTTLTAHQWLDLLQKLIEIEALFK